MGSISMRSGVMIRLCCLLVLVLLTVRVRCSHDYADALSKSLLFFEGQRSGKLPPEQRLSWRKDSALKDGSDKGVDLVGGYYDAGDNVKFNFPMAFTTTILAWSVLEFGHFMGPDLGHAREALRWGADYLMKATSVPGTVYAGVGAPQHDHYCWERPEDMDTPRTSYAVTKQNPGSELSAEMAAALAASSIVFRAVDPSYSKQLRARAKRVFHFADKYRGSYNDSLGPAVCPFYCDWNGYQDELIWGAAWLYKATKSSSYWNYVVNNIHNLGEFNFAEFGWDAKHAGINVLVSKFVLNNQISTSSNNFVHNAEKFICSVLPESPTVSVSYSPGGLLFKSGGSNLQHTCLSFLIMVYAGYMNGEHKQVECNGVVASHGRLIQVVRGQVDYILGSNPLSMSYMVGYGDKYPLRIHHRGSTLPSLEEHPKRIGCRDWAHNFESTAPNHNMLTGAVVGGPNITDDYPDLRSDFERSEPATYITAPLVGLLAYFTHHTD